MKNKNLLKVFGIALLVTFVLTWIIPSTSMDSSGLTTGAISSIGFADIFTNIEVLIYYFATPSILILLTGALYGIINKTGAFKATVTKLASIFKKKGLIFLAISVILFAGLSAVCGLYYELFLFIPLFIAVLLELKFNKLESVLATVGAATLGLLSRINSSIVSSVVSGVTGSTTNKFFIIELLFLILLAIIAVVYVFFTNRKNKDDEINDRVLIEINDRKAKKEYKSHGTSVIVLFVILFVLCILGFAPWSDSTLTSFSNFHNSITGFEIGNFAIISSLIGNSSAFGTWTTSMLFSVVGLMIVIFAIRGKLSIEESFEGAFDGMKKIAGVALFALVINLIVIFALNSGFVATISKVIMTKTNSIFVIISSLVSNSFMVTDVYSSQYLLNIMYYAGLDKTIFDFYGLVVQFTFGFVSLIAPSSILLMTGLYYTGEKYTNWFKYIWKFLVIVFILMIIALFIAKKIAI